MLYYKGFYRNIKCFMRLDHSFFHKSKKDGMAIPIDDVPSFRIKYAGIVHMYDIPVFLNSSYSTDNPNLSSRLTMT